MLWEGVGVLAAVLGSMGEFDMARRLLDSVIPLVSLPHTFEGAPTSGGCAK